MKFISLQEGGTLVRTQDFELQKFHERVQPEHEEIYIVTMVLVMVVGTQHQVPVDAAAEDLHG